MDAEIYLFFCSLTIWYHFEMVNYFVSGTLLSHRPISSAPTPKCVIILLSMVPCRHNDLPWNIRKFTGGGKLYSLRLESGLQQQEPWSKSVWSHTDLPRLREGRVGAQVEAAGHVEPFLFYYLKKMLQHNLISFFSIF